MTYRIGRDNNGITLTCLACAHKERVLDLAQDFDEHTRNPRTLAAQAMLKHIDAEHSRLSHLRAMAMVVEQQHDTR